MITHYPLGRRDLHIGRRDRVLEIGSGHNPMYRSDVLTDKFADDDSHRCGAICIYPHQRFIDAEGEHLPFGDGEFDYVICNQVLEHAEDPALFIREIMRVGRRGYIETPSLTGEHMFPKEAHKWVILVIDGKLVFYEKSRLPGNYGNDYGELFLNYLPFQSFSYKLLKVSEPHLLINRIEWSGSVDFLVNPEEERYSAFFTRKWDREMTMRAFPPRSALTEMGRTLRAGWYVAREMLADRLDRRPKPMSLETYRQQREGGGILNLEYLI